MLKRFIWHQMHIVTVDRDAINHVSTINRISIWLIRFQGTRFIPKTSF